MAAPQGGDGSLGLLELGLGRYALLGQVLEALLVSESLVEVGAIARDGGLSLTEMSLERARVETKKQLPLLDDLPFGDDSLHELAVDAGLDGDRRARLHVADAFENDRDVPLASRQCPHRRRRQRLGFRGPLGLAEPLVDPLTYAWDVFVDEPR